MSRYDQQNTSHFFLTDEIPTINTEELKNNLNLGYRWLKYVWERRYSPSGI